MTLPRRWWLDHYPRLAASGEGAALGMVECIQEASDTIFVPAGDAAPDGSLND